MNSSSMDRLEKALRRNRSRRARQNYLETGSATRWGRDRATANFGKHVEGVPGYEPIYWNRNSSAKPFNWAAP
jgi:hypothetical protein